MKKKTGLALAAVGLALPWVLMFISINQHPIKKVTTATKPSVDLKNLKIDATAIANGDYTCLTGTWQNSAGLTIIFNSKGIVVPKANKISQVSYRDGYARAILTNKKDATDAYRDGAGIWFYPAGVANQVTGEKQKQDAIVIASTISKEDDPYYKVSTTTKLTDTGGADTSSDVKIENSQGTYTTPAAVKVKTSPSENAETVATYGAGQIINYDQIVESDNQKWLSYANSSGLRRYVLMEN